MLHLLLKVLATSMSR